MFPTTAAIPRRLLTERYINWLCTPALKVSVKVNFLFCVNLESVGCEVYFPEF